MGSALADGSFLVTATRGAADASVVEMGQSRRQQAALGSDQAQLRFQTVAWGRLGSLNSLSGEVPMRAATSTAASCPVGDEFLRCMEWDHGTVWEHWVESEQGFEQRWTLWAEPGGDGPTVLVVDVGGASLVPAGDGGVWLVSGGGAFHYGAPTAWDALGQRLPAHLGVSGSRIEVVIDAEGAVFPVTVDPTLRDCAWQPEPDADLASSSGTWVSFAGDLNGDGFVELALGARPYSDPLGGISTGEAVAFYGSAVGLSSTPAWRAAAVDADAYFSSSLAGGGDFNGDGYSDLLISWLKQSSSVESRPDEVVIFFGGVSGPPMEPGWRISLEPLLSFDSPPMAAQAGDVNGDGFDDVLVGAVVSYYGSAHLYLGSAEGPGSTPDWSVSAALDDSPHGSTVAAAGDVNGDGFDDILVGDRFYDPPLSQRGAWDDRGAAYLYLGSATGPAPSASWMVTGAKGYGSEQVEFGSAVASAGDVNADGFADILVGAPGNGWYGDVHLYLGSADGPSPIADWVVGGDVRLRGFGSWLRRAGDFDGDGFDDIAILSVLDGFKGEDGPGALLYRGGTYLPGVEPEWLVMPTEPGLVSTSYGFNLAGGTDVNGDGRHDLITSTFSEAGIEPRACLVLGRPATETGDDDSALVGDDDCAWEEEPDDDSATEEPPAVQPSEDNGDGCGCIGPSGFVAPGSLVLAIFVRHRRRERRGENAVGNLLKLVGFYALFRRRGAGRWGL